MLFCVVLDYVYIVLLKECRKNLFVVAIFAIQVIEILYLLGMGLGEVDLSQCKRSQQF